MTKTKRTTISDIAKMSGYSKTAVSFAFNCPQRISTAARERILAVAKDLDYMPDPMARNFSLGKHMTAGFLLPQVLESSLDNPYTQKVIIGMGRVCEDNGYSIMLIPPLRSSIPEAVKNATVDGIIAMGIMFDQNITEVFRRRKLPVVVIDASSNDDVTTVTIDDEMAAEIQMRAALEKGHRDIAIISLPDDAYSSSDANGENTIRKRMKGYYRVLKEYGIKKDRLIIKSCDVTLSDSKRTAFDILSESTPSCFVCMSDIAAMGVISAIKDKGLDCPKDISVIGFDGITNPLLNGIDLTTIVQDPIEKGKLAAQLLFSIIAGSNESTKQHTSFFLHEGETLIEFQGN